MESKRLPILIVGATGRLGSLVTKHALANPNLLVNILVRNPQKNPELAESVQKAGGKVIQGDLEKPETLKDVTKGIHTVISVTSQMEEKIALHGQISLIDECVHSGVERFVPSDFSLNINEIPREELAENLAVEYKLKIHDYLKDKPIKTLHIFTGAFVDSFFEIHPVSYGYWGNKERKYDLTTYEDTAKVVVAAVAQEKRTGDVVAVGSELNITEITEIYNRVRGTNLVPKHYGSLEDLKAKWEEAKKIDRTSHEAVFFGMFAFLYDDRSKLQKTDNKEFSEINFTTVEEYLVQNPSVKLPE